MSIRTHCKPKYIATYAPWSATSSENNLMAVSMLRVNESTAQELSFKLPYSTQLNWITSISTQLYWLLTTSSYGDPLPNVV